MDMSLLKKYDYFEALQYRYHITRKYPFLSAFTVGKSVMGREIPAFMIGSARESALFVGGMHGNAQFTSLVLMTFLLELCEKTANDGVIEGLKVRKALAGRSLIVVPCINPDSCEIAVHGKSAVFGSSPCLRRALNGDTGEYGLNARGCDIDLMFSKAPLKEPESAALYSLCENNLIRHAVVLDKGNGEIVFAEKSPEKSSRMAEIMVSSTGYNLRIGNPSEKPDFTDWFSEKYSAPAVRLLSSPKKKDDYRELYASLREFLMLSAIM